MCVKCDLTNLSLADLEGEGFSPVPWRVDLLAVGEGQRVVTGHLLTLGGEGGAVALLHRLDVDAHGGAEDENLVLGGGVENRRAEVASWRRDKQAKPDFSGLPAKIIYFSSWLSTSTNMHSDLFITQIILIHFI